LFTVGGDANLILSQTSETARMSKLMIHNDAAENWQTILEQRASLLLSTLGSSVPRITVRFQEMPASRFLPTRYCCIVSSSAGSDKDAGISAEHPDGEAAIDGAMRRFQRQVVRTRSNAGREFSATNFSSRTK